MALVDSVCTWAKATRKFASDPAIRAPPGARALSETPESAGPNSPEAATAAPAPAIRAT